MPGGLLQLVGVGAQNELVNGNPSMTHFRTLIVAIPILLWNKFVCRFHLPILNSQLREQEPFMSY
jgi:hypothetical protein